MTQNSKSDFKKMVARAYGWPKLMYAVLLHESSQCVHDKHDVINSIHLFVVLCENENSRIVVLTCLTE